jgi:hypothetical protein
MVPQHNIVMFAASGHSLLAMGLPKAQTIIHQNLFERVRTGHSLTLRTLVGRFPNLVYRSLWCHLGLSSA